MGLLIVGDVGAVGAKYHAGDEAMLAAAIDELTSRGFSNFTVISADPAETAARYGVRSVGSLASTGPDSPSRDDLERRCQDILDAARGHLSRRGWDDRAAELIDEVAECDGLLVSGGGNLSSLWPEHIFERSTLTSLANHFDKPVVFSGQMLGPHLTARDGELMSQMLTGANLVGLRDSHSFEISGQLGVDAARVQRTFDDAMFLRGGNPAVPAKPYCAITVSPYAGLVENDAFLDRLAGLLDSFAEQTGLSLLLLPHLASLEPGQSTDDAAVNQALAARLKTTAIEKPILDVRDIASLTRGASLSLSTRYHPVVFAVSGGVPAVGIPVDGYTQQKIVGALANVGLAELSLPAFALASSAAANHVDQIWQQRDRISEHLLANLPAAQAHQDRWWDRVAGVFNHRGPAPVEPFSPVPLTVFPPAASGDMARLLNWQTLAADTSITSRIAGDVQSSSEI
ncbi:MAG: polysaccharide pyruvyl transferase family protein, partial [Rhodoglobus sp.]